MPISQKVKEEMLPRLRQRYAARGKEGWSKIIDELCDQFGYSRKHALKLMGAKSSWRRRRKTLYSPEWNGYRIT